jgi:hypothetical protein
MHLNLPDNNLQTLNESQNESDPAITKISEPFTYLEVFEPE